jgi:hypothetical protein
MAIGNAIQRGSYVHIYDETGRQLSVVGAGSGLNDGLVGYTSSTVSVRRGSYIYIYDEKGRRKSVVSAR